MNRKTHAFGAMGVDWETQVDFERLLGTRKVTCELNRDGAAPRLPEPHSVGN